MTVGFLLLLALGPRWLAPDGSFLPFTTDDEVEAFLASADIIAVKELTGSRNAPKKLTLSRDDLVAHAVFRTVDKKRASARIGDVTIRDYHDSYRFECAAYELSRLLGIENVPPCIVRRIDGETGSLQLWIESAVTEFQNRYDRDGPTASERSPEAFRTMAVFDALIDNFDRHPGNVLVDQRDRVWFIDHTRSFRLYTDAPLDGVPQCAPSLRDALVGLERGQLETMKPYVGFRHIDALWRRRKQLLKRLSCNTAADD